MENITISDILHATNGKLISGNTNQSISSVCIDSRKVSKGSLFVPLAGKNVDGHSFIPDAFKSGASACLTEKEISNQNSLGALIQVKSTLEALQALATHYRKKFSIPVIGITGSVGKTTTKEMIASVLGETLKVLKTYGNYNGQIGLPLTIFKLDSSYQVAVLEMGISQIGEMDRLRKIANPDIAVITNVGLSHVENFKSVENTCIEKLKIIEGENKKLYINGDSPSLSKLQASSQIIRFGVNGAYPYKCEEVNSNQYSTNFILSTENLKENINIPCLGMHNVYNALAAIAIALDMGIHLDDIKNGLLKFHSADMRQQISKCGDVILIDDSYNASPDSVKSSVSILKNINSSGKNILVIADMLELGKHSAEIHFETGRYLAIEKIDILITVGKDSLFLSQGAKSVNQNIVTMHFNSNLEAYSKLKEFLAPEDKVLIKGSRGMHVDEIAKWLKQDFLTT